MDGAWSAVLIVLLGFLVVSQVAVWVVLYQLIQQRGRLLLRLDELEHGLPHAGHGSANGHVRLSGELPVVAQASRSAQPVGLAVGTAFAPFRLPDLAGQEVSLEDFRGKRVLLVHWSPQCGFCDLIGPDLAKLQPQLDKAGVQLVLVSYGEAERNRRLADEHGLTCPILLQAQSEPIEAFRTVGTPVAYLLDEQGRVARPLAIGAEQVPALAREAAGGSGWKKRLPGQRPLSDSRIEREGLKAGTRAPLFSLPDLRGNTVSLESYRGQRVLLVFTDPHCGPCDQLAPDLARLHREHRDDGLAVVMIGRGDPEENRRKAEQYGFEFPVVVQERWELSKQYGIFATPVGFLVGEDGTILHDVARGADPILALARDGVAASKGASHEHAVR